MARLPGIVQQPVGEYALGNIATPNAMAPAKAMMRGIDTIADLKTVAKVDEATGSAADELSELRAVLVNNNTLDAEWVGDDALGELQMVVTDGVGGRKEVSRPKIFTHEVAADIWDKRSAEIIENYANSIPNAVARQKFRGEMTERYLAPGTQAVVAANAIRSRAYSQAQAQRTVEQVLSSDLDPQLKEAQSREVIARQLILGADPLWAENQLAAIGPMIDQIEVQNQVRGANSAEQVDQVEEGMWASNNRMTPETMRSLSTQMDKRRQEFKTAHTDRQREVADDLMLKFAAGELTIPEVASLAASDQIDRPSAWTFINALDKGSTTKATDAFTLSRYRGEIQKLQFVGNNMRMTDKARLLRAQITMGTMGLNPNGTPTGQPATISGEDAFKLNKDIDTALKAALENDEYDRALKDVYAYTRVKVDFEGQLSSTFSGNQNTVEAAVAFKSALDNYMNSFGIDAKPAEFVNANKEAFNLNNFSSGVNANFAAKVPQATQFMTMDPAIGKPTDFNSVQQDNFILWLSTANLAPAEYSSVITLFDQYYRGKGIAPDNGRLMLEPDDPLYRQFQSMIPDNE